MPHPERGEQGAPERLSECVAVAPHSLGQYDPTLHATARDATKKLFDQGVQWEKDAMPYISSLLNTLVPRPGPLEERKRKRDEPAEVPTHPLFPPTALDSLVLEGMDDDQIWHQLELRSSKLSRVLHVVMSNEQEGDEESEGEDDDEEEQEVTDSSDEESGFAGASDFSDTDGNEVFYEPLHSEEEQQKRKAEKEREEMLSMYNIGDPALLEAMEGDDDKENEDNEEDEDEDEDEDEKDDEGATQDNAPRGPRHPTLDDDFFSIDDFNRQTEADERRSMTSRANLSGEDEEDTDGVDLFGNVDEDGADDIHYSDFFDPVPYARKQQRKERDDEEQAGDEDEEDDGEGEREDEDEDEEEEEEEDSEPRKTLVRFHDQVRVRPIKKAKPSGPAGLIGDGEEDDEHDEEQDEEQDEEPEEEPEEGPEDDEPEDIDMDDGEQVDGEEDEEDEDEEGDEEEDEEDDEEEDEDDGKRAEDDGDFEAAQDETASRVTKDLFAEDEDAPPPTQSTHERRMAAIRDEIAAYERENVQQKDWTLMGEASAAERPADSLLGEDLEFERTAKVAPAVTQEDTEEIEAMIKRRILERQYDDVIRQREIDPLPFAPSRLLELSDAKSGKSLAELYEDEYQSTREAAEGAAVRPEADVKLEKEHGEISADIEALFGKLDALSNAHYTPKAPKATIETLSNTAAVDMENALPTTMSTGRMLAPEEIYSTSAHNPSMTGAKSEMTPQEKRRLHNQLRQSKRKRNDRIKRSREAFDLSRGAPRRESTHDEKEQALKSLVGNKGVSVVGKDSKRQSVKEAVSGKKNRASAAQAPPSAGSQWKL